MISLVTLLENCIIGKQYKVSDNFVRHIALSELGQDAYREILSKRRVKPNELKLAIFLEIGCPEGLLLDLDTDVTGLRKALSAEIKARRILFPYIFGRDLHDMAAEQYPEQIELNNTKSVSLLKQLPPGVFQEGNTVVGPFGAIVSDEFRQISARVATPGYLRSDQTCPAIHNIYFQTADSAIVKARSLVTQHVAQQHGGTHDEHARVIHEAILKQLDPLSVLPSESLIDTLADSFTETELRIFADAIVRNRCREEGGRTELSRRIGAIVTDPTQFIESLERPALLQLILCFTNREIAAAVDLTIREKKVTLEEYEVRISRLRRDGGNVRAEIGPHGVRSTAGGVVAERLFGLLHRLYYDAGILEPADLEYGLAPEPGIPVTDLLGLAVRRLGPRDSLRELVLPNRRAAWAASEYLGIVAPNDLGREDLLESMLWKLGAPTPVVFTELERIDRFGKELLVATDGGADEDVLRGHISNLFTTVEDALQRSLTFCAWAFMSDHFLSQDGFLYDPLPDVSYLGVLDELAPTDVDALQLKKNGKNTLAPLAAGFGRLAKVLKGLDPLQSRRPDDQLPLICRSSPRPFAFPHIIPFLNLPDPSQLAVTSALQTIASVFADSVVVKVRNSTQHGNNDFPSAAEIRVATEKVAEGRACLSRSGLFPQVYALQSHSEDAYGRSELRYARDGHVIDLHTPSWPVAPRMPVKHSLLVIVEAATLGASGPLRFGLKSRPGRDIYWDGWPKRWRVERAYSTSEAGVRDQDFVEQSPAELG